MKEAGYQPTVVLYVKSLAPPGTGQQQEELLKRIQGLTESGQIDGFTVEVWGERIPCDTETAAGKAMLEQIRAFEAWSSQAGTSLSGFFQTHGSESLLGETERPAIVPPTICLAEYDDETLQYVAPCTDGGTVCTVIDRLNTLETNSNVNTAHRGSDD